MSVLKFKERWPQNVPGRYYVYSACLDCAACTDTAPDIFARYRDGYAYVHRQPTTEEEERRVLQAIKECPLEAIAGDGSDFDPVEFLANASVTGGTRDPKSNS
jgi:ferredoxin